MWLWRGGRRGRDGLRQGLNGLLRRDGLRGRVARNRVAAVIAESRVFQKHYAAARASQREVKAAVSAIISLWTIMIVAVGTVHSELSDALGCFYPKYNHTFLAE